MAMSQPRGNQSAFIRIVSEMCFIISKITLLVDDAKIVLGDEV